MSKPISIEQEKGRLITVTLTLDVGEWSDIMAALITLGELLEKEEHLHPRGRTFLDGLATRLDVAVLAALDKGDYVDL